MSTIETTIPYKPAKLKRKVSKNCETIKANAALGANPKCTHVFFKNAKKMISICCTMKNTPIDAKSKRGAGDKICIKEACAKQGCAKRDK